MARVSVQGLQFVVPRKLNVSYFLNIPKPVAGFFTVVFILHRSLLFAVVDYLQ